MTMEHNRIGTDGIGRIILAVLVDYCRVCVQDTHW